MNTCIFCGPTTERITSEHIFSDWISRRFRKFGMTLFESVASTNEQRSKSKKVGAIDLKVPVVCETCNNVWLSQIERDYLSRFFFDMVRGKPRVRLGTDDLVALIAWLTRLAMVYEFRDKSPTDPTFFTPNERKAFYDEPLPPKHTWIWIADYRVNSRSVANVNYIYRFPSGKTEPRTYTDCIFILNGVIGRFAFQLCSRRWPSLVPTEEAIAAELHRIIRPWEPTTIQLWPSNRTELLWEPPPFLVSGSLQPFFERFGGHVTF
jgi:hypothetical protein